MKKTITVHIANFIFNIEEEAYQQLQSYLTKISAQFSVKEEREEIMYDIESRISELFREQLTIQKEVIVEEDVLDMIAVMGSPEEYIVDEEEKEPFVANNQFKEESKTKTKSRQIYRDEENAILGGVCSGLAAYFGVDPIVLRILFIAIILMGGSGILIYLILYFAIPAAKTLGEKLKMKGEKVDVSSIKNQFEKVKEEISNPENKKKVKTTFNKFITVLVGLFSNFISVFSKFIGLAFLITGIVGSIALVIIFNKEFLSLITEQSISIAELLGLLFESATHRFLAFYSLVAVLTIPIISMIITGVNLLFGFKNKFKRVKLSFFIFWVLSVCMLFIVGVYLVRNFEESSGNVVTNTSLNINLEEPLLIDVTNSEMFPGLIRNDDVVVLNEMVKLTDSMTHFAFPRLVVEPSETDSFSLEIIKRGRGRKETEALINANSIVYDIKVLENHLILSDYFSIPLGLKFRGQNIKIVLKVPKDSEIKFGNYIDELTCSVRGEHKLSNTSWVNRKGRMIKVIE